MGSHVLPQALSMIPRNFSQCPLKKVGFFSSLKSVSSSRVSPFGCRLVSSGFSGLSNRHSFVVRAEAQAGAEAEGETEPEMNAVATEEVENESATENVDAVEKRPPKKPIVKLGDVMGILHKQAIEAAKDVIPIPDLRTGDIVEIKWTRPTRRRRFAIYKGIIISKQNAGIHTTIRIRRIIAGGGVEIIFPIYSPNVQEIKVIKHRKVRRARLYYLKDKLPRFSTFK